MSDITDVDGQPNGVDISKTFLAINEILTNPEFEADVKKHNGWPEAMPTDRVALLFLACRYQSTVDALVLRTDTLKREVDGANTWIKDLEDRLQDTGAFSL